MPTSHRLSLLLSVAALLVALLALAVAAGGEPVRSVFAGLARWSDSIPGRPATPAPAVVKGTVLHVWDRASAHGDIAAARAAVDRL
jgi:hypothetical protein